MFEGPRLKVKRGTQHIEDLHNALAKYFSTGGNVKVTVTKVEANACGIRAEAKHMPEELSLLLGDAIHNLRSALDLLAVELVRAAGEEPSRGLYFPVSDTKEKLAKRMREKETQLFGKRVCSLIEEEIKPYKEGHPLLWALHQADIGDKHTGLVPTFSLTHLTLDIKDLNGNTFKDLTLGVAGGTALLPIVMGPGAQVSNLRNFVHHAFFPKDSSFGQVSLVPTLRQCANVVEAIINGVEFAHQAPQH